MRQEENNLTPALREFESALAGLTPEDHRIDRDRLIFEAGKRSVRPHLYAWRAVAAVLAAGLGLSIMMRPADKPAPMVRRGEAIPQAGRPPSAPEAPLVAAAAKHPCSYLQARLRLLQGGPEALPAPAMRGTGSSSEPRGGDGYREQLLRERDL